MRIFVFPTVFVPIFWKPRAIPICHGTSLAFSGGEGSDVAFASGMGELVPKKIHQLQGHQQLGIYWVYLILIYPLLKGEKQLR